MNSNSGGLKSHTVAPSKQVELKTKPIKFLLVNRIVFLDNEAAKKAIMVTIDTDRSWATCFGEAAVALCLVRCPARCVEEAMPYNP